MSGGTISTAVFQLGENKNKNRSSSGFDFDPLLMVPRDDGEYEKSSFATQITNKKTVYVEEFKSKASPWIMAPVMANCVRRSNALKGYANALQYGDTWLDTNTSLLASMKSAGFTLLVGAAIYIPYVRDLFLPKAGEGPDRQTMEQGYLKTHGRAIMVPKDGEGKETKELVSKFHFQKDTGYLMTAEMLVECGILLLETKTAGGVLTPATAFGESLTSHLCNNLKLTFELQEKDSKRGDTNV